MKRETSGQKIGAVHAGWQIDGKLGGARTNNTVISPFYENTKE